MAILAIALLGLGAVISTKALMPSPIPSATTALRQPVTINRDGKVLTVTVDGVRKSDYPSGAALRPGYELLSVMVTYRAAHNSEDARYNEWDWSAKAAGHRINTYPKSVGDDLGSGDLFADGEAHGYVTFEVPTTGEVVVEYRFFSLDQDPTFELAIRSA